MLVINVGQEEPGTANKGKEPLKTLSTYRMTNNKVLFGQNVLCGGEGVIGVGDEIKTIKTKPGLINYLL